MFSGFPDSGNWQELTFHQNDGKWYWEIDCSQFRQKRAALSIVTLCMTDYFTPSDTLHCENSPSIDSSIIVWRNAPMNSVVKYKFQLDCTSGSEKEIFYSDVYNATIDQGTSSSSSFSA